MGGVVLMCNKVSEFSFSNGGGGGSIGVEKRRFSVEKPGSQISSHIYEIARSSCER